MAHETRTQPLHFPGGSGHPLAARLELPLGSDPIGYALFAHCFTCSKNLRAAVELTRSLSAEGWGVLRFDFTGLGESEGDFADTGFVSNVEDLVAAARHMEETLGAGPSLLVGHSLGGAAVLQAAPALPSVKAVATIGAPADPSHVLRHISASLDEIERDGRAEVSIGGRPFTVGKKFLEDLEGDRMGAGVEALGRALLILHAPLDDVVGIDNARRLYEMARHPKSFMSLDGADHLLSDPVDSGYVGRILATWAARYLPAPPDRTEEEIKSQERVTTRTAADAGFRTEIRAGRHALVADEPESVGGMDEGPTPYDLLLAALGTCTSMTLQMYARRKGWALNEARVHLSHQRLHARDCEACSDADDRLDEIDRKVELVGDLSPEERSRLMEIADRCPVHRTLDAGIRIATSPLP